MARFTIYFATDIHGSERCIDRTNQGLQPRIANSDGIRQGMLFTLDGDMVKGFKFVSG